MENNYVKNCFTCEFGFDNDHYHKVYNPVHPEVLEITCNGSDKYWGEKVEHDFCCECWEASLREFSRCERNESYEEFYRERLALL